MHRDIPLEDEAATVRLGHRLASGLAAGDMILLEGDLGSGKTTLARAIIQARAGMAIDVPSPTFNLVIPYDLPGLTIAHFDLYRLSGPDDTLEIGLEDAMAAGVCLVEWPDRLDPAHAVGALAIRLERDGAGRRAILDGPDEMMERLGAA
ncbi:MAG: tRNA (adenosine(37)-N6)-threonylcarbamoyltransferase complex ATPase subunit type 1 TsaE [Pseudomonadota bacterium]|nr:tRNA (adenosine(37)-N6)-threonylcarbamoyltransferase complex ATPase subunit type 1 TsaE [Pseudomonadota bacterium]